MVRDRAPASANMPQPQAAASSHLSPEELAASAAQEVERARRVVTTPRLSASVGSDASPRSAAAGARTRPAEGAGGGGAGQRELVGTISSASRKVEGSPSWRCCAVWAAGTYGANGAMMHKAYRRALALYHPDRATRQGLPWQKVAETEEVYKLLQLHHDAYLEEADG